MAKARWILGDYGRPAEFQRKYYAILETGRECDTYPFCEIARQLEVPDTDLTPQCVIVDGPIFVTREVPVARPHWTPGSWHVPAIYNCTNYYTYFGEDITQREYTFITFGEILRRWEWLFKTFGVNDSVFIRPDEGEKIFVGEVVHWDKRARWTELMLLRDYLPQNLLCVVSKPRRLLEEHRLMVHDGKVVTGSSYRFDHTSDYSNINSTPNKNDIVDFAERAMRKQPPDMPPVYVLDVAREEDRYSVLEVGCILCAGWYACDYHKAITAISEGGEKQFDQKYGGTNG